MLTERSPELRGHFDECTNEISRLPDGTAYQTSIQQFTVDFWKQ